MRRRIDSLLAVLAISGAALLVGCVGSTTAPQPNAGTSAEAYEPSSTARALPETHDRLIVVTFEAHAQRGLSRPGASPKGYQGGGRGYRTLPSSERTSQRLARSYGLVPVEDWPIALLDVHCVVYAVPGEAPIAELITRMEGDARVKSVQRFHQFHVLGSYDDPYLRHQKGLQAMQIEDAHAWATGHGVRVAVVDTGIDFAHPDLRRRVRLALDCVSPGLCRDAIRGAAPDFSADAHGTAVAGVIASAAGNGEGIVGVAPDVEILALKACWYPDRRSEDETMSAVCNTLTLAKAIQLAIDEGADILNLSLAGPRDPLLNDMIDQALARGAIVVGAIPPDDGVEPGFPASNRSVITVEAYSAAPGPARRRGDPLSAPGENVLTTQPGGEYDFVTGSSFAAAHVTGLAALLLERDRLPSARLRELLRTTSDANTGVNACGALATLLDRAPCASRPPAPAAIARTSAR